LLSASERASLNASERASVSTSKQRLPKDHYTITYELTQRIGNTGETVRERESAKKGDRGRKRERERPIASERKRERRKEGGREIACARE